MSLDAKILKHKHNQKQQCLVWSSKVETCVEL